ncbi:DUF2442 domain-containing protein [Cyanothece sp. BG0011]|uniref:DUF2442 domain-containing protein n=1 Tax=Cyanothece sp. BG0011 TaxID=2082950 RepID=UPI000D1F2F2E|nr:DUF2442 domain-containing protein [Cyanothece sp. BG0011]
MNQIHNVQSIALNQSHLILSVDDKTYHFPLSEISQKLAQASEKERTAYQISPSGYGIHWPLIDEDLSINGLLKTAETLAISSN